MVKCEISVKKDITPDIARLFESEIKVAIRKACMDTAAHAISRVPVDTGALKGSITTDFRNINSLEGEVATGIEYAPHVEFGTVKQPAQPYMLPAAELVGSEFVEVIATLINSKLG